jgi:hypothetical protein
VFVLGKPFQPSLMFVGELRHSENSSVILSAVLLNAVVLSFVRLNAIMLNVFKLATEYHYAKRL